MRVLIAARLSQKADGQTGIETQDLGTREWAEREGHTVVAVAADRKSGTVQPWDRPNLKPWVTQADKLAQYDAVAAYRLDRLSRGNDESTSDIEAWARRHGKLLLTEDGLRYPCEGADGIRWDVSKRIAHEEWLKTSERYRRMQTHLRSGGYLVGRPPFGYDVVPLDGHKTIAPNDEGRDLVPWIFDAYLGGDSLARICERIGAGWWPKSLSDLLRNTTYAGHRKDGSGRTVLRCEPVVDAVTFARAGKRLDSNPKRRGRAGDVTALLTSVLACAKCSGPMYKVSTRSAAYYRCVGSGPNRKSECRNMIRVDELDSIVDEAMSTDHRTILEPRVIPGSNHDAELEAVKLDIRSLDVEAGDYLDQHSALMAELGRLKTLPATPDVVETVDTGVSYTERWESADHEGRRAILLGHVRVSFEWDEDEGGRYPVVSILPEWQNPTPV